MIIKGNNWYFISNTKDDCQELMKMFWEFHDFRVKEINYRAALEQLDLLLEYDDRELNVILRFSDTVRMKLLPTDDDYDNNWIFDALLFIDKEGNFVWNDGNGIPADTETLIGTWIQSAKLQYAVVDGNGNTIKIPDRIVKQVCKEYNYHTNKWEKPIEIFYPKKVR